MLSVCNGSNVGTPFLREIWGLSCFLAESDFIESHSLHIEAAVPLICVEQKFPKCRISASKQNADAAQAVAHPTQELPPFPALGLAQAPGCHQM